MFVYLLCFSHECPFLHLHTPNSSFMNTAYLFLWENDDCVKDLKKRRRNILEINIWESAFTFICFLELIKLELKSNGCVSSHFIALFLFVFILVNF